MADDHNETSTDATMESRLIAEGETESVPIDIEEEEEDDENEEEDYEDVADEQDDDDNEDENDVNDEEEDEGKLKLRRRLDRCLERFPTVLAEQFSNQPTTEAATNARADAAFDAIPEIPDGVDPSFLAALPQEMREEVLAEHIRWVSFFFFLNFVSTSF